MCLAITCLSVNCTEKCTLFYLAYTLPSPNLERVKIMNIAEITNPLAKTAIIAALSRKYWGAYASRLFVAKHGPECLALYRLALQLQAMKGQ